ncbi:ligase-associated DNA damage response endonuclease PdeM [Pseudooceanicola sp. LIPI14-2-Ac024]|uniref:ligase-associated DNA damage response endonuclease PdeM n=1 Tax=Pseudooceanicola sp. LIPI14-2-Ac024 TaxID=3344875 RepID=UPI0035CFAEFF
MTAHAFSFHGATLHALGSGALHWPDRALLVVSDLHLGKSERVARRTGQQLPPYETRETLSRLEADIEATGATSVLCLGDSFDDRAAALSLDEEELLWLTRLQAGRRWIWVEGNHDPGPLGLGGEHRAELALAALTFRHIAQSGAVAEVSGHYHPKASLTARGHSVTRPCFLLDADRLILPAYGAYTGGLRSRDPVLATLMRPGALAILTGKTPRPIPMPR